jgi:hypothetical protein
VFNKFFHLLIGKISKGGIPGLKATLDAEVLLIKEKLSTKEFPFPDISGYRLLSIIDFSLPDKLITSYNKEIDFKQEMRGNSEIITEDLRLMQRFFYQLNKIMQR